MDAVLQALLQSPFRLKEQPADTKAAWSGRAQEGLFCSLSDAAVLRQEQAITATHLSP